jgi:hypothetical protein
MNPRIDSVVKSNDGHHATVSGPINWDDDETSATFAATVGQMGRNGQIVFAAGQNATVFTRANDQRWETQVSTLNGKKLALGVADGWATAAVLETAGYKCYPWQVDGLQVTEQEVVVSAGN